MVKLLFTQYYNADLKSFTEKLDKEYYDTIYSLCDVAKKHIKELSELEVHQSASQYIVLCARLVEEIQQYIKSRKEVFIPYIGGLFDKEPNNTDSARRTERDSNSATYQLPPAVLSESLHKMKDMLHRLQMVSLPLYSEGNHSDIYKVLRNQMSLIENGLSELFLIEETYMIPKLSEAQKNTEAN